MADDNLILGKNYGLMLGNNQQMFAGHNHNLGFGGNHMFGLGNEHEQGFKNNGFNELSLGHSHAPELVLGNTDNQGLENALEHEQGLENNRFDELALACNHAAEQALGNIDNQGPGDARDREHEQGLKGNGFDELSLSYNHAPEEVLGSTDNQGVENAHEHEQCLGSNGFSELASRHNHGAELVLENADNLELPLVHDRDVNLEEVRESKHAHGVKLDPSQDRVHKTDSSDHIGDTDHELALIAQGHGFGFLESHDLEVVDGNELDHNLELAINQNQMMDDSSLEVVDPDSQLVVGTPIVQARALVVSPDHELKVGREFSDVNSCRRALRDAAIAHRFEIRTVKSDKTRFTAKCATEGCPWRIHAAKLPGLPTFSIRTIYDQHTCGGITHVGHQQASVQWVASTVEQHLRENPHCKPKEILEEIHRLHGITLSYKQAWRGKERVMASLRGSFEEDYRLLPQYCDQLKRTNPGSIASVFVDPSDSSFQRMFISFQASIYGFVNACQPLLGIDTAPLKNKYVGTLLFATGFDGDGALFPLAFGVVNEETDDNWMWFLCELHHLLETNTENMPRLTILSDRRKGIVDAVESSFPTAFHGYCMRHLCESFQKDFNNPMLVNLFWEAAHALSHGEFETKMLQIQELSRDAAYWIRRLPLRLWATAYFEGSRFGHLTATKNDTLNAWIHDAASLPIIQMMEYIRRQLMMLFNERRQVSMQWDSVLVPTAERHVTQALEQAHEYQVFRVNEADFEVISHQAHFTVNVKNRSCECRGWELYGLPCAHAAAALNSCRQSPHRFTECFFTVAAYRKAYSQTIHPIPDKSLWKDFSEGPENGESVAIQAIINPPRSLQLPAQPRKKRVRPGDEGRVKRVVHCSRCQQPGHFRTTCPAPM